MYMRFYWVQDRIIEGHYKVFWKLGATHLANYFTKHRPTHHRFQM